jgi:hypothetical protein
MCARVSVDQGGLLSEEHRDEQPEQIETEPVAAWAEDEDPEPDFELHGQYFDAPSE